MARTWTGEEETDEVKGGEMSGCEQESVISKSNTIPPRVVI